MIFCIAPVLFWRFVGFDTMGWRTSNDGTRALCHSKFAAVSVPDWEHNPDITCYDVDSPAFQALLATEFTPPDLAE
jgi:hypothetical protein